MSKKTFTVAIVISALLVSMHFEISTVSFANATYTIHQNHTLISIQSPITNGSYAKSTIPLVVNVSLIYGTTSTVDEFSFQNLTCLYSLDNSEKKNITSMNITSNIAGPDINYWNGLLHKLNLTYSTALQDLTEGSHSVNITLTLADSWGTYQNSSQAYFILTPNYSPSPTPTPSPTQSPTQTPTQTPTPSPIVTPSPTVASTATSIPTIASTPSSSPITTSTLTPTPTPSETPAFSSSSPSVPQFTLEPVGPSFDIPPTYTFNASAGMFDTNNGYHIQYSAVKIIIKNQPFSDQTKGNNLYYNVRIRPHNYPDCYWLELFSAGNDGFPIQTLSNYTIIPLPVEGAQVLGVTIPTDATTDIQVEAMIGHIGRNNTMTPYPYPYVFFGETSGWSNTQTITIPANVPMSSASPSPSPISTLSPSSSPTQQPTLSPSPTLDNIQAENYTSTIIILGLVTIAVAVGVIVYFKKRRR